MAGLVLSCGGGSNSNNDNCGQFVGGSFIPEPCTTTVPPLGPRLESIDVCAGPPASPTIKPSATPSGAKPSPTPTHTPCANVTTGMVPNPVALNAAGLFKYDATTFFRNLTSGAGWFADNSDLSYIQNGQFAIVNPGCTCVYASSGGIVSGPMGVAIAPNGGPFPSCTPCPTVEASPTATPKAAEEEPGPPVRTGKVMWRFDAHSAVSGRIVAAPSGGAVYFITGDGLLHALNSAGQQVFVRSAGGLSPAVAPNGTIYAEGTAGGLMALSPGGKLEWLAEIGRGVGPLAVGTDGTIYDATATELVALDVSGAVEWRISMPGVRQAMTVPGAGIIAVTDGGLVALAADGASQWSFAPPSGIAGNVAISGDTLYAMASNGTLYALNPADGSELWHRAGSGASQGGVAANGASVLFEDGGILTALDSAGTLAWSSNGFVGEAVAPVIAGSGTVFAAAQGGHLAAIGPEGEVHWIAGNFGQISSMTFSSSDTLYVVSTEGTCWSLKEIFDIN
ncbi:MAG TPA: PQQ-binding-like beta-propeller repeat protein [Candidatus Binataceae bacterium]|nr:PQQ-binding-like beta-propeller repeat protein [Candidatus Binataceae bacterium]